MWPRAPGLVDTNTQGLVNHRALEPGEQTGVNGDPPSPESSYLAVPAFNLTTGLAFHVFFFQRHLLKHFYSYTFDASCIASNLLYGIPAPPSFCSMVYRLSWQTPARQVKFKLN
jgi:hypothetical protein